MADGTPDTERGMYPANRRSRANESDVPPMQSACSRGMHPALRVDVVPHKQLAAFNRLWEEKLAQFRRFAMPPWWAPGLVLTPDIRFEYERFLPVQEFLAGLHALATEALPHPSWVPGVLRAAVEHTGCCGVRTTDYGSLPDLWQDLPTELAGLVRFSSDELLPLLCALADPPRFGTDFGRYPDQLCEVRTWAATQSVCELRVLDIGCGTGQGTCEIAAALRKCGVRKLQAAGLTREPLEAWMGATRTLPHDPRRQQTFRAFPSEPVAFLAGDAGRLPFAGAVDLIVCNGLVGGRSLHTEQGVTLFLRALRQMLRPTGRATLANRFHEGHSVVLQRVAAIAAAVGWKTRGDTRLLWLWS